MSSFVAPRVMLSPGAAEATDPAYKARIKNGADWRRFKNRLRLEISVGAEYHNGPKFAALKDLINRNHKAWLDAFGSGKRRVPADDPKIEAVDLCVNCTLQRYNVMAEGVSEQQATADTLRAGTEWLAAHKPLIDQIGVPVTVHRWPEWLGHPEFEDKLRRVKELARNDETFRDAVRADIETIIERRTKHGKAPSNQAIFRDCSEDYIHEELAAFALMKPAVVMYPGSNLACVEYFLTREVPGLELLSAVHRTRIDFDRAKPATTSEASLERNSPHAETQPRRFNIA